MVYGTLYAGVDYNLTYCNVHYRVDSNTFTMGNSLPESTLTLCQSRLYPPVRDFGFGWPLYVAIPREENTNIREWTQKKLFSFGKLLTKNSGGGRLT